MKLSEKLRKRKMSKNEVPEASPAMPMYSEEFAKRMAGNVAILHARSLLANTKEEFKEGMELLIKMACVVIYTNFGWDEVRDALRSIDEETITNLIKELEGNDAGKH